MDRRPPFQVTKAPSRSASSIARPLGRTGIAADKYAHNTFAANLRSGKPFTAVPRSEFVPRQRPAPSGPFFAEPPSRYQRSQEQEGEATGVMRRARIIDTGRPPHAEIARMAHRVVNERSEMANQIAADLMMAARRARADALLHGLRGTTKEPFSGFRPSRDVASHASSAPPRTAVAYGVTQRSAVVPPYATDYTAVAPRASQRSAVVPPYAVDGSGRSRPNAWLNLVARVRSERGVSQKEAMKLASAIYRQ
jgi:hypothetical protein